jgi:FkbM family methyltransferase
MLRRSGREVVPYDPRFVLALHRRRLLADRGIDLVLDVGANVGQTGEELRGEEHYRGRIISFEPQSAAYKQLKALADLDPQWQAINSAIGEIDGSIEINLSGFHASSSLLPMLDRHVSMMPGSAYVGKETVAITRLDTILPTLLKGGEKILLKIDTQGYELSALRGAEKVLNQISLIHVEVSLVGLYEGQPKYYDVMAFLDHHGFDLIGINPQFYEQTTAHFLQADAMFARRGDDK